MPGFGDVFGGFMEGYTKTLAARHQERREKFSTLMDLARSYYDVATRERAKGPARSQKIIDEAEQSAQDAVLDAEKAMNQKIGGLSKLASIFGFGKGGGEKAASTRATTVKQLPSDQTGISPPPSEDVSAAPEAAAEAPPYQPRFTTGLTPQQEQWAGLAKPPAGAPPPRTMEGFVGAGPLNVPGGKPTTMGQVEVPKATKAAGAGKQGSLSEYAKTIQRPEGADPGWWREVQANLAVEEAKAQQALKLEVEKARNQRKIAEEDFNEDMKWARSESWWGQLSPEGQATVMLKLRRAGSGSLPTDYSGTISGAGTTRGVLGEDGQYWDIFRDRYGKEIGRVPSGATAATRTAQEKFKSEVDDLRRTTPSLSEADAELKVSERRNQTLQNKLKQSNFNLVAAENRDEAVKLGNEIRRLILEQKRTGAKLTPGQAFAILRHADSMAQFLNPQLLLLAKLQETDPETVAQGLLTASENWLKEQGGPTRDELLAIVNTGVGGKSTKEQADEAQGDLTGTGKSVGAKKTGPYNPDEEEAKTPVKPKNP